MSLKSSGISIDPKILAGFHIGMIAEFEIAQSFYLQPGVLYSGKGSKYSIEGDGMSVDMSIKPGYIEIPVNALYKVDLSSAKLQLFAGPYFAFGIGGNIEQGSDSEGIKFGSTDNDDMKMLDVGLNFGAGIEIKNFIVSAQYGIGLTNLAPVTTNGFEMKMSNIGISVALMFGSK
jgi:hypothetical protein